MTQTIPFVHNDRLVVARTLALALHSTSISAVQKVVDGLFDDFHIERDAAYLPTEQEIYDYQELHGLPHNREWRPSAVR